MITTTRLPETAPAIHTVRETSGPYQHGVVMTRTPLRISFAGGGTDLAAFYEHEYGQVFSTAINKYMYVTVKRHSELFYEPIRINYSKTEQVNDISEVENGIARECLRLMEIEPPIYVSVVGDMPASTGLGGSSSFAVGLLQALHTLKNERVSAGQLAEEASHIEIDVLRQPIGKQDQYAAAFGGLNVFRFEPGGRVTVEPQRVQAHKLEELFRHTLFFWTGMQRDASSVLLEQRQNTSQKMDVLRQIKGHSEQLRSLVAQGLLDPVLVGRILHETWLKKRELAGNITTQQIDQWYDLAMAAGAEGGKLCGAGGGGFLLLFVRPENRQRVRTALADLKEVDIRPEVQGSTVMHPFLR
jgi:D-glycero-alpha-D-manno-heptose-7-phosphate kinase